MGRTLIWIVVALGLAAGAWLLLGTGDHEGHESFVPVELPYADEDDYGPVLQGSVGSTTAAGSSAAGRYPIRGVVVDRKGARVGSVAIVVRADGRAWDQSDPLTWGRSLAEARQSILDRHDKTPDEQRPVVATGRADAEGQFVVLVPNYGKFRVYAVPLAPRVGVFHSVNLSQSKPEVGTRLLVLDGGTLEGRVVDASEAPVAAQVMASYVTQEDGTYRQWGSDPVPSAAADGTFHMAAVPLGNLNLWVVLPNGRRISGFRAEVPYKGDLTLRLPADGGSLAGTVSDAAGAPVAGAAVIVRVAGNAPEDVKPPYISAKATTDAQGHYQIDTLPAGRLRSVEAVADGFLVYRKMKEVYALEIPETGQAVFDMQLDRGGRIVGRLTETGSDTPIPSATISLNRPQGRGGPSHTTRPTTTDAQGHFRFEHIEPGAYVVLPEAAGYYLPQIRPGGQAGVAPMPGGTGRSAPAALTVVVTAEGKEAVRNLTLARGYRIAGQVLGANKRGIAAAEIFAQSYGLAQVAWAWGLGGRAQKALARSDADGRFVVEGLPPYAGWVVYARKEEHAGHYSEPFALGPDTPRASVTLTLSVGAVLQGVVEGLNAAETTGAQVSFWGTAQELAGKSGGHPIAADGTFEIRGVPPGDWRLNLWANGRQALQTPVTGVKAGETRSGLVIRMKEGVEVVGVVVASDGKPVGGLQVFIQVVGAGGSWSSTSTDSSGRFTFKNVAPGRAQLNTWGPTGGQVPVGKPFQTTEGDVRLIYDRPTAVTLRGEVQAVEGTAIAVCRVQVKSADARSGPSASSPVMQGRGVQDALNGSFEIKTEGAGPWVVSASNARAADGTLLNLRSTKTLVKDPSARIVLRMEAGRTLSGRVVDSKGAGLANVRVQVAALVVSSDAKGFFQAAGLGERKVVVQVTPPPGLVRPPAQTVASDAQDLVFTLIPGLSIKGVVYRPDGEPLSRGFASATWKAAGTSAQGSAGAQVRAGGKFEVLGIPPGVRVRLQVQAWSSQGGTAFAPVVVENVTPGASDLEVRLGGGLSIDGRIIGPDGKPPVGCFIYGRTKDGSKQTGWVQVTEKGTFRLGGLDPVPYEIRVMRQDGGALPPRQTVTPPASSIVIQLPKTSSLAGRLEGIDAATASGWRINAWREDGTKAGFAQVAADGSWRIDTLADGAPVLLRATKQGDEHYAKAGPVAPGSKDVTLRLRAGESISGTVDGAVRDGRVVAILSAEGADGWTARGAIEKDGTFRISGLPPGRYVLRVRTYGEDTKQAEASDVRAGTAGVALVLE